MTITAKLRHETHLDHEMREYYQARIKPFPKKTYIAHIAPDKKWAHPDHPKNIESIFKKYPFA